MLWDYPGTSGITTRVLDPQTINGLVVDTIVRDAAERSIEIIVSSDDLIIFKSALLKAHVCTIYVRDDRNS